MTIIMLHRIRIRIGHRDLIEIIITIKAIIISNDRINIRIIRISMHHQQIMIIVVTITITLTINGKIAMLREGIHYISLTITYRIAFIKLYRFRMIISGFDPDTPREDIARFAEKARYGDVIYYS